MSEMEYTFVFLIVRILSRITILDSFKIGTLQSLRQMHLLLTQNNTSNNSDMYALL